LMLNVSSGNLRGLGGLPQGRKEHVAWSANGRWLAFAGRTDGPDGTYGTENVQLLVCDLGTGRVRNLTDHTDYCLAAAIVSDTSEADFSARFEWAPDSRSLLVRLGWHGETQAARLMLDGKLAFLTRGAAGHDFGNLSSDGRRAAFVRTTATRPPEIFLGELSRRSARLRAITDFNTAWARKRTLAPIESHWITSADGAKVQVWTMYPP